MQKEILPKLSNNTRSYLMEKPFQNDKLERKKLAEKLTKYLERLNDGAVLAIDAPWGEGKTWFGINWNKSLKDIGYKTIYIDSFEQDYMGDPFILLSSELLELIKENGTASENKRFKETAAQIAKSTFAIGSKVGINLAARLFLGNIDLNDEIEKSLGELGSYSADSISKTIENRFDNYKEEKKSFTEFKEIIKKYAKKQEKPIVIFIDELDRCKPSFAVNLIERIKHFFDVPNIVFILLLNRKQLENAIKGIYGDKTDANKYLDKFINFYFTFQKLNDNSARKNEHLKNFIILTMSKYNFQGNRDNDKFIEGLLGWCNYFDLSLRDIEKCIALYAFAYPSNIAYLLSYFIVLKIKNKELFERLVRNDKDAHLEAMESIDILKNSNEMKKFFATGFLDALYEWHNAHYTDFKVIGDNFKSLHDNGYFWSIEPRNLFHVIANMIEVDIER